MALLNRRQFLRDLAIGSAVLGGGLLAACQPSAPPSSAPAANSVPPGGAAAPTTAAAPAAAAAPTQAPAQNVGAVPGELPRNDTMCLAGWQWGPPTTFNPFGTAPCWPNQGTPNNPQMLMYESLFGFNLLSGNLDPLLAKDISWLDANTAQITLQSGTHWQDGQALTTDDVVYTWELGKKYKDVFQHRLGLHHRRHCQRRNHPAGGAEPGQAEPGHRQELPRHHPDPPQAPVAAERVGRLASHHYRHAAGRLGSVQAAGRLA